MIILIPLVFINLSSRVHIPALMYSGFMTYAGSALRHSMINLKVLSSSAWRYSTVDMIFVTRALNNHNDRINSIQ